MNRFRNPFSPALAMFMAGLLVLAGHGFGPRELEASNIQLPTGTIIAFAGQNCPSNFLAADGTAVSRTTYAALYSVLGNAHGRASSSTFNVPDLRGRFLRGVDLGIARDPDRASRTASQAGTFTIGSGSTTSGSSTITVSSTADLSPGMSVTGTNIPANSVVLSVLSSTTFQLGGQTRSAVTASGTGSSITFTFSVAATADFVGSVQTAQIASHNHTITDPGHTHTVPSIRDNSQSYSSIGAGDNSDFLGSGLTTSSATTGISINSTGGNETRPINVTVKYCIKT